MSIRKTLTAAQIVGALAMSAPLLAQDHSQHAAAPASTAGLPPPGVVTLHRRTPA